MSIRPAPPAAAPSDLALSDLGLSDLAWLLHGRGVVVLTGAGISTDSGIPDYRGPTGARRRSDPMTYQEFTSSSGERRRYWARSHLGWPLIDAARPNTSHELVALWEQAGLVDAIITQNVDGLHQRAGAREVIDLHGRLDRVICLGCHRLSDRRHLERRFSEANPGFDELADRVRRVNPDGDVDLPDELVDGFAVVGCELCGGVLKPDVVYFGESVPKQRAQRCLDLVRHASALVVLGSSLAVMSGYRFVRLAHREQIPVAIVNAGPTRGDGEANVRIDAMLAPTLTQVSRALGLLSEPRAGSRSSPA